MYRNLPIRPRQTLAKNRDSASTLALTGHEVRRRERLKHHGHSPTNKSSSTGSVRQQMRRQEFGRYAIASPASSRRTRASTLSPVAEPTGDVALSPAAFVKRTDIALALYA